MSEMLDRIRKQGWKWSVPTSPEEIEAVEDALRVRFPKDYREFLLEAGGKSSSPMWRGLFRVDELISLNRAMPVFQWFKGLIGIGNEGMLVYALDYRQFHCPPIVSLGLSSSYWDDVNVEGESFSEWLERTLPSE